MKILVGKKKLIKYMVAKAIDIIASFRYTYSFQLYYLEIRLPCNFVFFIKYINH